MQKHLFIVAVVIIVGCGNGVAQRGSAPNGYYPPGYSHDTFTGIVSATEDATQSITLEYSKGKKSEFFTGRLDKPCGIPTKDGKSMKASDVPTGTDLTAYYNHKTTKIGDQKHDENVIIALTFNSFQGKSIPESSRKLYYCTGGQTQFQAH